MNKRGHQLRRCFYVVVFSTIIVGAISGEGQERTRQRDVLTRRRRESRRQWNEDYERGLDMFIRKGKNFVPRHRMERDAIAIMAKAVSLAHRVITVRSKPKAPRAPATPVRTECRPLERPLVAYAGTKVELVCQVCESSSYRNGAVSWQFRANGSDTTESMDGLLDDALGGFQFGEGKRSLVFRKIRPRNSGKYFCSFDRDDVTLGKYDITVLTEPYDFHMVFQERSDPVYEDERVDGTALFTHWSEWTGCNHCGEWGERFRFGYCYARLRVQEYPQGVPCRSNVLTYAQRRLFARRSDERVIRECEVACPRGFQGNSLDDSTVMETYHDFDLGRPSLQPEVEKQVFFIEEGGNVELLCPGGGMTDAIRWENGSQHLAQVNLGAGRVQIDSMHVLHIRDVMPQDAQVYTCYSNMARVASMTVNVMQPLTINKEVRSNLWYVGLALTGLVGLIILVSVFKNRKRHSFRI